MDVLKIPEKLFLDIALCGAMFEGQPASAKRAGLEGVAADHGMEPDRLAELLKLDYVKNKVRTAREELSEDSLFRYKARAMAEQALISASDISRDTKAGAAARMDANKSIIKWAGLDQPPKQEQASSGSNRVMVQINFKGAPDRGLTLNADGSKARGRLADQLEADTALIQEIAVEKPDQDQQIAAAAALEQLDG